MANETLSILKDQARLTVIGKSKADTYIDSGLGLDLGDLPSLDLDSFDLNWQIDVPDPENLPDEIRIISPPYKTEYRDGEKIDLSGAIVGAYKNGYIWTSTKYPNGHIPLGELIVSPLIATDANMPFVENEGYYTQTTTYYYNRNYEPDRIVTTTYTEEFKRKTYGPRLPEESPFIIFSDRYPMVWERDNQGNPVVTVHARSIWYASDHAVWNDHIYTQDGKTVHYGGPYSGGLDECTVLDSTKNHYISIQYETNIPVAINHDSVEDPIEVDKFAWNAIFGENGEEITISWARPDDHQILTTSFNVAPYIGD